ncbi:MAG: four helix bundle protein, partial [Bacillati bacterium ANGP1]
SRLVDADGEATETQVWLDFARGCGYLTQEDYARLLSRCEEVGRMLGSMIAFPKRFSA